MRDLDEHLGEALKREADRRGLSVNRLVLELRRESVGLSPQSEVPVYTDLDHLAGIWSAEDAAEFERLLAGQRSVGESL